MLGMERCFFTKLAGLASSDSETSLELCSEITTGRACVCPATKMNSMGAHSARLLSETELGHVGHSAGTSEEALHYINIERHWATRFETAGTALLSLGVVFAAALMCYLFIREWQQETSYRAWLLLASVAPLILAAKEVWIRSLHIWGQWGCIQVVLDSMSSAKLFDALAECVEQVAESRADTCSSDVEAFTSYDKTLGGFLLGSSSDNP